MDASSALFSNQLIRGLSLATSSPDKFTRDVRSVDIPSNAIALAISRFPAFWFNSRISLTFHERCVPCALDPLAVAKKKKEREKRKVNDLQRNLLFLQVRFERLAPLENPKIEERISFRVEHAISSFRRREFREISRDSSSYFTLGERITGKSRFLFRWPENDALDKKSQTINFLVNENNCVVPRWTSSRATFFVFVFLPRPLQDTLKYLAPRLETFAMPTSGMPPTFLEETLFDQPISTISSFPPRSFFAVWIPCTANWKILTLRIRAVCSELFPTKSIICIRLRNITILRGERVSCFSFDLPVEQYLDFCAQKEKKNVEIYSRRKSDIFRK